MQEDSTSSKKNFFSLPEHFWEQISIKTVGKGVEEPQPSRIDAEEENEQLGEQHYAERRQAIEAKEKGLTCLTCHQLFPSVEAQQAHFKTDWHLFNLQRRLVNQESINKETFLLLLQSLAEKEDELEDEEEEEVEEEEEEEAGEERQQCTSSKNRQKKAKGPRMRIVTADGRAISFWRAILPSRELDESYSRLTASQEQRRCVHASCLEPETCLCFAVAVSLSLTPHSTCSLFVRLAPPTVRNCRPRCAD